MNFKIGILSHVVPPQPSGQAIILGRLIEGYSRDQLCLITNQNIFHPNGQFEITYCNTFFTPFLKYFSFTLLGYKIACDIEVKLRSLKLVKIIKHERLTKLVICSGDLLNFPSGLIACKKSRIDLIPYFFDDYVNQWTSRYRKLSLKYESELMSYSTEYIIPNEFLHEEYLIRYGKNGKLIRNLSSNSAIPELKKKRFERQINIGYWGSIYRANIDVFISLLKGISNYKGKYSFILNVYTAQPKELIIDLFKEFPFYYKHYEHLTQTDLWGSLEYIDILYLPLGFNTSINEVIRTSAPGKLAEYLHSGLPIIAHVPEDSFVSWYFKNRKLPYVLSSTDTKEIINILNQIISDISNQRDYSCYANCAQKDFNNKNIINDFIKYIDRL